MGIKSIIGCIGSLASDMLMDGNPLSCSILCLAALRLFYPSKHSTLHCSTLQCSTLHCNCRCLLDRTKRRYMMKIFDTFTGKIYWFAIHSKSLNIRKRCWSKKQVTKVGKVVKRGSLTSNWNNHLGKNNLFRSWFCFRNSLQCVESSTASDEELLSDRKEFNGG